MPTLRHKRPECIGCDVCVEIAPDYFFMADDGLASLYTVQRTKGDFSYTQALAMDTDRLREAAEECPVDIIRVES